MKFDQKPIQTCKIVFVALLKIKEKVFCGLLNFIQMEFPAKVLSARTNIIIWVRCPRKNMVNPRKVTTICVVMFRGTKRCWRKKTNYWKRKLKNKTKLYGNSRKRKNCNGAVHADGKRKMLRYFVMIVPDVTSIDDLVWLALIYIEQ